MFFSGGEQWLIRAASSFIRFFFFRVHNDAHNKNPFYYRYIDFGNWVYRVYCHGFFIQRTDGNSISSTVTYRVFTICIACKSLVRNDHCLIQNSRKYIPHG